MSSEPSERVAVTAAAVWPEDTDEEEGIVANWFYGDGATVDEGETLCEIQVEKVDVDVPAPATGTVVDVQRRENDPIGPDDPLAYIEVSS